ncbi:hypothetical protein QE152_g38262 [Popillia japonica]|uniref:Uncharacterized protein n=1 Tax=Popillia japonica TaxID=7064 RepID=A0AAW1I8F1_POPJA
MMKRTQNKVVEEEIRKEFSESREELRKNCKEQLFKVQEINRKGYNLRRKKARVYQEGHLAAIKRTQFGTGLKINRKFLGPYKVVKVKNCDRYDLVKVGNHEGPLKTSTRAEYIKPWVQNETESEADS